jgi:hypothetical protein
VPEVALKPYYADRLLVVGPPAELKRFDSSNWSRQAGARYIDVLEFSKRRWMHQFETDEPPLDWLKRVSKRCPTLVFLLDYDDEDRGIKGLAKAYQGRLEVFTTHYG